MKLFIYVYISYTPICLTLTMVYVCAIVEKLRWGIEIDYKINWEESTTGTGTGVLNLYYMLEIQETYSL